MSQPPIPAVQRLKPDVHPDRLYVLVPGLDANTSRRLARSAVRQAQAHAPKLSGRGARGLKTYWGTGFFGIRWDSEYMWFQNAGVRPFTMRNLAGKVIPMWIDDPTGKERRRNPKAKTRITASGKHQVLIFRKAAPIGARKTKVTTRRDGTVHVRDVPQSYPGAPGRIALRTVAEYPVQASTGRIAGRSRLVTRANIGVRWRFPGLAGRHFVERALVVVCQDAGLGVPQIYATYRRR